MSSTTAGQPVTWSDDTARRIAAEHAHRPGPLLEVLHAVQRELGYIDASGVAVIADELNLSRAEVHGVVTFYSDLRTEPPARTTVQICRGEACQAVGGEALVAHATAATGAPVAGRSPDGQTALEQVFCLGNCALGPCGTVAGQLHGRLTPQRLDQLVAEAAAGGRA